MVLRLLQNKLDVAHSLFMNNFYNSFSLCKQFLKRKTFLTGTLRVNRKNFPDSIKNAKLRKGETTVEYANGIMVGKW